MPVEAPALGLRGVDFSSAPSRRKPIVLAEGSLEGEDVRLRRLRPLPTLADYALTLREPGPWIGGFDFPFSLPAELVHHLGWPTRWPELIDHYARQDRAAVRALFADFCASRPAGAKFATRACERPAGASPAMKWINPPVALMLHAGVPPLLAAGCDLPGLHAGDPARVALEAYPGYLARRLIGRRSYKQDAAARQTDDRRAARDTLVQLLETGALPGLPRLRCAPELRCQLVEDGKGDCLDATLCLVAAGWATRQPGFGRPTDSDPLEGWILTP